MSSAFSPATTTACRICPDSIMVAASDRPLMKPRQALATSKLTAELGSSSPWCRPTAADGSRFIRVTEVLMSNPTSSGLTPASARARWPARTVAESTVSPSAQLRRSFTPATRRKSPLRSLRRSRAGASCASMWSDVVTRDGSTLATESSATFSKRTVAFPATGPPSGDRCRSPAEQLSA